MDIEGDYTTRAVIRKAALADIPQIMGLHKDYMELHIALDDYLAPYNDTSGGYAKYLTSLLDKDNSLLLVSYEGDIVTGYLLANTIQLPPVFKDTKKLSIYDIAVNNHYQRHGIGKKLVDAAIQFAKEQNIRLIDLHVHHENKSAYQFWSKIGFEENSYVLRRTI